MGGRGAETEAEAATNSSTSWRESARFESRSMPIVEALCELIPVAQSEPPTCPGSTSRLVGQLGEPLQRREEVGRALARVHREVRSRGVADQERVAGQEMALDEIAAVLGPVAGCVQDADRERSDPELLAVLDGVERERRLGQRVNAHRRFVLEREPSVTGDVVCVRVRLEHANDPHARPFGLLEVGLDRVGGIHYHRLPGPFVADQVGRAAEVVVHKLPEQHVTRDVTNASR